jgi:hypothetical protein
MFGPSQLASLEENWKSQLKVGEIMTGEETVLTNEDFCHNQRGNVQRSSQVK